MAYAEPNLRGEGYIPLSRKIPVEFWAGFILLLSIHYRLSFFSDSPFPMNDGAVFLRFFEEIAANNYRLPDCVMFNKECITFTYPPLSFYFAALATEFGFTPLEVTKWYGNVVHTIYTIIAFFVIKRVFTSQFAVLACFAIFAFHSRSFEWLIMGGGISRVTAACFFALTLLSVLRFKDGITFGKIVLTGLAVGATLLSHPEWGIAAAAVVTVYMMYELRPSVRSFAALCAVGCVSALCLVPWLYTALSMHGLGPFRAAAGTSDFGLFRSVLLVLTFGFVPPPVRVFCAVAIVVVILRRDMFWLLALVVMQLLVPRSYPSAMSGLPLAILAAIGIDAMRAYIAPWLDRATAGSVLRRVLGRSPVGYELVFAGVLMFFMMIVNYLTVVQAESLVQISDDAVEAMEWANDNVEPGTKFVMVTGQFWAIDEIEEWFPLVTDFELLSLVRGTEWFDGDVFETRRMASEFINLKPGCTSMIETVGLVYGAYDIIFDAGLTGCFETLPGHEVIFENEEVRLISRR
ncbi:MAG: hypothetical protein AAFX45_15335 [Pseudomonadota bacterium]